MSIKSHLRNDPVSEILFRSPPRVSRDASVLEVVTEIQSSRTGSALVVDGDRLVGIFTERDYLRFVAEEGFDLSDAVETVMSPKPRTLHHADPILMALELMHERRYRNIPVVDDDGRPMGIVRVADLLRYLAEVVPGALLNLPPKPQRIIRIKEGA
jgi:CBS domain-containing protein